MPIYFSSLGTTDNILVCIVVIFVYPFHFARIFINKKKKKKKMHPSIPMCMIITILYTIHQLQVAQ